MISTAIPPNAGGLFNSGTASRRAQALCHRLQKENPNASDWELREAFNAAVSRDLSLYGLEYPDGHVTEDWLCVDCGATR